MDEGASDADTGATSPILRLTTEAVDERHRPALMGDVMARALAGGEISALEQGLACDWTLAALGPGTVLGRAVQRGFTAARGAAQLRDDDADLSIFVGLRGAAPFEQNDRRVILHPGEALLVAHGRAVQSWWSDGEVAVLRLPRDALSRAARIEAAGGMLLTATSPAATLLRGYLAALWPLIGAGTVPGLAARHLAELAELMLDEGLGQASPVRDAAGGMAQARLARMREVMRRRHAEPGLAMAVVAAAIGLSERAGYLVFEAAGERFAETLYRIRLERAAERIRGGYAGRLVDLAFEVGFADASHFNRQFRRWFGMTPSAMREAAGGRAGRG